MPRRSAKADNEARTPEAVSGADLRKRLRKMLDNPQGATRLARIGYEVAVQDLLCWLSEQAQGKGTV